MGVGVAKEGRKEKMKEIRKRPKETFGDDHGICSLSSLW